MSSDSITVSIESEGDRSYRVIVMGQSKECAWLRDRHGLALDAAVELAARRLLVEALCWEDGKTAFRAMKAALVPRSP